MPPLPPACFAFISAWFHLHALRSYFSGVFLLLSAVDHFAVATIFRSTYEYYLKRAMNPFR